MRAECSKYSDNKMTIQSLKNRTTGRIKTKLSDFHHQNQYITPQNIFTKKSLSDKECRIWKKKVMVRLCAKIVAETDLMMCGVENCSAFFNDVDEFH